MEATKRPIRKRRVITKVSEKEEEEESRVKVTIPPPQKSEGEKFGLAQQVIHSDSERLVYFPGAAIKTSSTKWGQRKLILAIMQFFIVYWDPKKYKKPTCVYVGAAPGVSINVMAILFPDITWHLYDTAPFNRGLPLQDNVTIHDRYFTDDDTKSWRDFGEKKGEGVFFVSDIRSLGYDMESSSVSNEKIVIRDMAMQQRWVFDINPIEAQLKLRLPYVYVDGDKSKYPYLQGVAYFQSWLGKSSSETRLVPTRNEKGEYYVVDWDPKQYEDVCSYHNTVMRGVGKNYVNSITGEDPLDAPELLSDWDSTNEVEIISQYLKKVNQEVNGENVAKISQFITSEINRANSTKDSLAKRRQKQKSS